MQKSATASTAREPASAPDGAARLSISLVGHLALTLNGKRFNMRTRKAAAVLGYLALSESKQESRERLVGLLWSRSGEERARASLRQVVRELRNVLEEAGFAGFTAGRLSVGLDVGQVDVDVESIVRLAEIARVHPLLLNTQRIDERLLEGLDDLDPSFRVWILAKRQTIYERLMRSLDTALASSNVSPETHKRIAQAIVNLDPTHEQACCYLMRARAEEGDVAGALRIYKALWDLLDRDYGMEPSKATEDLVASIKLGTFERASFHRYGRDESAESVVAGASTRGAQGATASLQLARASAKPCLVLRPFAMHGVDSDQAHLVQGFSLHLAASLVRFREWSVVDRPPASVVFSGTTPHYSIEATAYRAGNEINMVMVLKDDGTGTFVWGENFRLGLGDWFEAQQRIIRRIATSLNVQMSAERLKLVAGESDVSLDVYDRWLRGQSLMTKFDPESWQRAVAIFRGAINEDPTFSPGYSSLVQMNNIEHFVHPGLDRSLDRARVTLELAKTAVQLDPIDSRAHLCCGWSYAMALRASEAAPHMDLACELNENDPWTLLSCAHYSALCGSIEQASQRAEQSMALSPAPSYLEWGYHGTIRFLRGDYAGAVDACDRAQGVLQILPAWRAAALFHLGQVTAAREEAERFINGIRSFWVGASAPTDEAIARWTLQAHPISVGARWEALRDGLRGAGLPVDGVVPLSA